MSRQKQIIEQALLVLMVDKTFDEITMSDLIMQAGLGRATFYRYFKTKIAILEAINDRIREDIEAALEASVLELGPNQELITYVAASLDAYYDHRDELKILWGPHSTGNLVLRLVKQAKPFLASYIDVKSKDGRHVPNEYAVNLFLATLSSLMIFWLTKPLPEPPALFKPIFLRAFETAPTDLIQRDA